MSDRQKILRAMKDPDRWVLKIDYADSKQVTTERVISPIRYSSQARNGILALCLCREEPRVFFLNRIKNIRLENAHDFQMPVPIRSIVGGSTEKGATGEAERLKQEMKRLQEKIDFLEKSQKQ